MLQYYSLVKRRKNINKFVSLFIIIYKINHIIRIIQIVWAKDILFISNKFPVIFTIGRHDIQMDFNNIHI